MSNNQRLKTYYQKKENKDKRHFKRIYNLEAPKIIFYMYSSPALLIRMIYRLIANKDIFEPYYNLVDVAQIRQVARYHKKKENGINNQKVKLAYYINEYYIEVHISFMRKSKLAEYETFAETCQKELNMKKTNLFQVRGYYAFKLFKAPIPIREVIVNNEKHAVSIGTGFEGVVMWEFDRSPHCLIVGETGSGKSTFMAYLISGLLQLGNAEVWILDGKVVDYSSSQDLFDRYLANKDVNENLQFLRDFHGLMLDRYNVMAEAGVKNYNKIGLEPYVLIADEFIDVISRCPKDKAGKAIREEMEYIIGSIARLGRAAGMQLIISMQRPDTTYIDGNTRDQFQLRIVLGGASNQAYNMAFEQSDLKKLEVGKAWYRMGTKVDMMAIPLYEEIEVKEEKR